MKVLERPRTNNHQEKKTAKIVDSFRQIYSLTNRNVSRIYCSPHLENDNY